MSNLNESKDKKNLNNQKKDDQSNGLFVRFLSGIVKVGYRFLRWFYKKK